MRIPSNRYIIIFSLVLIVATSCRDIIARKHIREGIIKYGISYDSTTTAKIDATLLPSLLTVKFKNNNTLNTIEALSGAITISIISNHTNHTFTTMAKVFNKKFYHEEANTEGKYPALYSGIPTVNLISDNEPCKFLGYKCFRAKGFFADKPNATFEIIYTQEIDIANPNINTPFQNINGVMLRFNLRMNTTMMQLTAESVKRSKISDDTFTTPSDYNAVDFKTITELIYLLQQ
ncbi:MAG: hypothetical protein H6536_05585 [Bacteroidales bacterium]|nr:hypothetical protein [Bacteroidales bacterium]